jgi:hypothetical protein
MQRHADLGAGTTQRQAGGVRCAHSQGPKGLQLVRHSLFQAVYFIMKVGN